MNHNTFAINCIQDAAIRHEYDQLLKRSLSINETVHRHYGQGRKPIKTVFINHQTFNAFASDTGDHYLVEIDASIPLFFLILFGRMLSDDVVLPHLDPAGRKLSNYSLPFVIDPDNFEQREEWDIGLNAMRSFAANTLADLCSTFVICHEVGHILCGHVEGMMHHCGVGKVAELTSRSKQKTKNADLRKAWEYEADAVAATLMMNMIKGYCDDTLSNKRTAELFDKGEDTLTFVLALVAVSLFAAFLYMRGVRHHLNLEGTHPHPLVRAYYLKDMFYVAADEQWPICEEKFTEMLGDCFEEFAIVLEKIGLFDGDIFSDEYVNSIEDQQDYMFRLKQKYQGSCRQWLWINEF